MLRSILACAQSRVGELSETELRLAAIWAALFAIAAMAHSFWVFGQTPLSRTESTGD